MSVPADLVPLIQAQLLVRNEVSAVYIPRHSLLLANLSRQMSERFLRGGRLLAFGHGPYLSDAQHISVEFIHPIVVGKRALPALDVSAHPGPWLAALARPEDIVMGFAGPGGDAQVDELLATAGQRGALTCAWPGHLGDAPLPASSSDPFIHQELMEVMYHTLWETVHVFFDQAEQGNDMGASSFLYPSLARGQQAPADVIASVDASIRHKAQADEALRTAAAAEYSEALAAAAVAIHQRVRRGGLLVAFGNGGSASDANDLAIDCFAPPAGMAPFPAISLSMEPANVSAIANDVGVELVFLRQLIAHGRAEDVAVAFSTSGKSANLCAALREARKRGLLTVALLGYDGGDVVREKLADFAFVVRCDYVPRIQEVQATMYHVLRLAIAWLDAHA